jgi:hypothetical protein
MDIFKKNLRSFCQDTYIGMIYWKVNISANMADSDLGLEHFGKGHFGPRMYQNFSVPELFGPRTFRSQNFSVPERFGPRIFRSHNFSVPELFSHRIFRSQNFSVQELFSPRIFRTQKRFGPRHFGPRYSVTGTFTFRQR